MLNCLTLDVKVVAWHFQCILIAGFRLEVKMLQTVFVQSILSIIVIIVIIVSFCLPFLKGHAQSFSAFWS